jgi:linoleoyl-CoA desaturase
MNKINFPGRIEFDNILRNRVQNYLKANNIKETGTKIMQIKGLFCFLTSIVVYLNLVFNTETVLGGLILTFLLIQTQILLAFNVMHDAGHGSFSSKKWLNEIGAYSMEFLGASNSLWKQKHNSLHHTYTNIEGKDDDLDIGSLMRLSPEQELKPWHRFQHFYAPVLYGLLSLYMLFYSDFKKMVTKKIGATPLRAYTKKELGGFLVSKTAYIAYALIIPMFFHNPLIVIGFFLFAHFIFGLTLSVVFQLAHTVKETSFPTANEKGQMPYSWAEHQLQTTSNFAPNNKLVTFYCGGLNYQVEHHLFHKISHVHYPKISQIVKETCVEFNKPYHVTPTFWQALKSHFSFLKSMGRA